MHQRWPESGKKIKACCCHDDKDSRDTGVPPDAIMPMSLGGFAYGRTIQLALVRDRSEWYYWDLALVLISQDGDWVASLSRADAAALVSLDSVSRVLGWIHPEQDSSRNSVMFCAKTLHQPWLEPSTDVDSHGYDQPPYPPSPMGAAHDEEMRRLVDDTIESLIRGGD